MPGGVIVTGTSTGIGDATARELARHGFRVFGTVRQSAQAGGLREAGVTPVLMDVTDPAAIARARDTVVAALGGEPLVGLVNNAGIAAGGPLELLPLEELRKVFEVNVLGVVAVTQAFLPELRRARGRVVNISSVSGRLATPFAGPYCASKFALEAISDSLRRELLPSGVDVIVIQPGSIRTPIWEKAARTDVDRYRGTIYERALNLVKEHATRRSQRGLAAEVVARAVVEALTARQPRTRMLVVRGLLRTRLLRLLPDRWIDRAAARVVWRR